jgi:hypothetical protein
MTPNQRSSPDVPYKRESGERHQRVRPRPGGSAAEISDSGEARRKGGTPRNERRRPGMPRSAPIVLLTRLQAVQIGTTSARQGTLKQSEESDVADFGLTMPKQDSDRLLCVEHHLSCTYVRHERPSPEDVAEESVWLPEMIGEAANPSEPTTKPSANPRLRRQTLGSRESQKGILTAGRIADHIYIQII